jgi:hypothetical protein
MCNIQDNCAKSEDQNFEYHKTKHDQSQTTNKAITRKSGSAAQK